MSATAVRAARAMVLGVVVLAGGLSGAAARGDLGAAGPAGVAELRSVAVANPAYVEVGVDEAPVSSTAHGEVAAASLAAFTIVRPYRDSVPLERTSVLPDVSVRKTPAERCRPPKGVVCRRPPRNIYETVRRQLNAEGLGWAWYIAKCVIWYESRWSPTAVSPYGHLGLWQIDGRYFNGAWASLPGPWSDPTANTHAAAYIYRIQGWHAWSVHASCGV